MANNNPPLAGKAALVTGSAKRIGACFIRHLHNAGASVIIHYRNSRESADKLSEELESTRENSSTVLQADLCAVNNCKRLITEAAERWGKLDILVNNASSFYPTPVALTTESQWNDLIGSNLKAPFFLSQAAAPWLKSSQGVIINMVDIHGQNPLQTHPVYCSAKAGLIMLTRSLAKELAPQVRVNAIAPGSILWPDGAASLNDDEKQKIMRDIALQRQGNPEDLARTLLFLVSKDSEYITGQVLTVDGGRSP